MSKTEIILNGVSLRPDPSGALFWPERGWMIVADLHLEKGSGFAARGRLLPPYDTAATLDRLEATCRRLGPTRVICLGDSFHDRAAAERVSTADGDRIAALTAGHDWVWIAGNHDPKPPGTWGGRVADGIVEGALAFHHQAQPGPVAGEVSGHFHPKAAIRVRGRRIGGRCFVGDGTRLVLPAFGAFTGGLNVLDPAIAGLFPSGFHTWIMVRDKLFPFPSDRLESA